MDGWVDGWMDPWGVWEGREHSWISGLVDGWTFDSESQWMGGRASGGVDI